MTELATARKLRQVEEENGKLRVWLLASSNEVRTLSRTLSGVLDEEDLAEPRELSSRGHHLSDPEITEE